MKEARDLVFGILSLNNIRVPLSQGRKQKDIVRKAFHWFMIFLSRDHHVINYTCFFYKNKIDRRVFLIYNDNICIYTKNKIINCAHKESILLNITKLLIDR